MFRLCTSLSALLAATPVAADMPRYDVNAHCDEVAGIGGTYSSTMFNGCMDMEQNAYNKLKREWDDLSSRIQNHCNEVATIGGPGSYSMLDGCVTMELNASSSKKSFEY